MSASIVCLQPAPFDRHRIEADGQAVEADGDEHDVIDRPIPLAVPPRHALVARGQDIPLVRSASHTAGSPTSPPTGAHLLPNRSVHPVTKPRSDSAFPVYEQTTLSSSMQQSASYTATARSDVMPYGNSQSRDVYKQQQPPQFDIQDNDALQCPKCQMLFKTNDHLSLLEHINECV